jgi:tricarballylate dehydrogenase
MVDLTRKYDVLVIGGGNAALCAAISAARDGASVLVLEGAPKFYRGGNTRHTRNMRCAHDAATEILTGPYPEDEFWEDLLRVTGGKTDEELARHMIAESKDILGWIVEQGVRWQPSLGGTLSLGRTNSFFLGGGRAMLNALYLTAEQLGIEILYDAEVIDLDITDGMFLSATLKQGDGRATVSASALVAACGGFEANIEWLKQYWGDAADNFLIRGTPYNRGSVLKIRRRHHHKARLRRVWHRRQQGCPTLLRRRRGYLAEALCDLGAPRRRPAGPDRLHPLRCEFAQQLHADAVSADRGRQHCGPCRKADA